MTQAQELYEAITATHNFKVANCQGCCGSGAICVSGGVTPWGDSIIENMPCPDCLPHINALEGRCWHEWSESSHGPYLTCVKCKINVDGWATFGNGIHYHIKDYNKEQDNPTYSTVESIKAEMELCGEWEAFAGNWLWSECQMRNNKYNYYDVLTTPTLLRQVCTSYLKERVR